MRPTLGRTLWQNRSKQNPRDSFQGCQEGLADVWAVSRSSVSQANTTLQDTYFPSLPLPFYHLPQALKPCLKSASKHLNSIESVSGMFSQQMGCFVKTRCPPETILSPPPLHGAYSFVLVFRETRIQFKSQLVYKVFPNNHRPGRSLFSVSSHSNSRQYLGIQYLIICYLVLELSQGARFLQLQSNFFEINLLVLYFFWVLPWLGSQIINNS